jgi:hypothetical protein
METKISLDGVYLPSEEMIAREIQGEFIVIPVCSAGVDTGDELFTLNETGKAFWQKLDGKKSLRRLAHDLSLEFEAPIGEIEKNILSITKELLKRRMLFEWN